MVENIEDGIYPSMPMEDYLAIPRLSASGCTKILQSTPRHFRHAADNPEETEFSAITAIGSAAHILALEPHQWDKRVAVICADDYRKKDAQDSKNHALKDGKIPLLKKQADIVMAMNAALVAEIGNQLDGGIAERTLLWTHEYFGVSMKSRPDWTSADNRLLVDYKTTANASPGHFARRIADNGHHIQAALTTQAHEVLTGITPSWLWIAQETEPPYVTVVYRPAPSVLHIGADLASSAIETYAECLRTGNWPAYADSPVLIGLPSFVERQYEEFKEERHAKRVAANRPSSDRKPNSNLLQTAVDWQRP